MKSQWVKSYSIYLIVLCCCLTVLYPSCKNENKQVEKPIPETEIKQKMMEVNTVLTENEDQEIEDFISRYRWNMTETGSGLRYQIYHQGNGLKAGKNMLVKIAYKVMLINGTVVYDSTKDGIKEIPLGKSDVESGLQEGILLMGQGDKARLVLPSHLAHGFPGDGNLIPKRATVIYDIELLSVEKID